jgi:hypothetical protein
MIIVLRTAKTKVGPVGIEPTTHRLKVRPRQTALYKSNSVYPQVAIRPNLFGIGLTQPIFIFPIRELFEVSSVILEEINETTNRCN